MRATFYNVSRFPRRRWTSSEFTVPAALAELAGFGTELTFQADDGRRFRAVKGGTIGLSTCVRVRLTMGGHEMLSGELLNEPHPGAGELQLHPWCTDGKADELIARARYKVHGESFTTHVNQVIAPPTMIEAGPAHQLWHKRDRSPDGVIFEWWQELNHMDPVSKVWGKIIWSDRNDPNYTKRFDHIVISAGEQIAFDFNIRNGNHRPNQEKDNWGHMVGRNLTLDDGTGIPLSGAMLCYASPSGLELPPASDLREFNMIRQGLRDLQSGTDGPIVGVCHSWDGAIGACGNAPVLSAEGMVLARHLADKAWNGHVASMQVRANYSAHRPLGAAATPSQTGKQEDHGAVKGTDAVTLHDPRWIRRAQYSMGVEFLRRGYEHYETNGLPLQASDHPNWTTFNAQTWHNASPDKLGKVGHPPWNPSSGKAGYDEEHMSLNNLASYLTLTHDPVLHEHVKQKLSIFESDYRVRFPHLGQGATRAMGRTLGAYAQMALVAFQDTRERYQQLMRIRYERIAQIPSLSMPGPMKVMEHRGPDPRKAIFTDESRTTLAPWTSMWELGLACIGLKQSSDGVGIGHEVLMTICETIATYGCMLRGTDWWTVDDIIWNHSQDPDEWPTPHEWQVVWNKGVRGTGMWTRAGILVAREVLGSDHALAPKLNLYIDATGGLVTADKETQEWAAAIRVGSA